MKKDELVIELPSPLEVNAQIKTIIEQGLNQKKSSVYRRLTPVLVAATLLLVFFSAGRAFPGYASQIPFVGTFFSRWDVMFDEAQLDEANQLATAVGQRAFLVREDGLGYYWLTIEEVLFDGNLLSFSYIVESEHPIVERSLVSIDSFYVEFFGAEGANPSSEDSLSTFSTFLERLCEERHKYGGIISLMIRGDFGDWEEGEVRVSFRGATEDRLQSRPFSVIEEERTTTTMRITMTRTPSQLIELNEVIEIGAVTHYVESIRLSPLGATLHHTMRGENFDGPGPGAGSIHDLGFVITDNTGVSLVQYTSVGLAYSDWAERTENHMGRLSDNPEYLIITPHLANREELPPIIVPLNQE